ncbi:MAG: hypothetical protein WBD87_00820 [Candidatus Acidiferrales bacterium]
MDPALETDDDLDSLGFQTRDSSPHRSNTVAVVVMALAAVLSAVTQAKDRPIYADAFLVLTALAVVFVAYPPVVAWIRTRRLRAHRDRIARKSWPALRRLENRFAEFLSERDIRNLRYIINEIGGCQDAELYKYCPPDYLNEFFPSLLGRHAGARRVREPAFRSAVTEFVGMVASYNAEYVLRPLKQLRDGQRFQQLTPQDRKYREEAIEAFRERWVGFLDAFTEFVAACNDELGYEPHHEAIPAHFERPKKLS